MATEINLQKPNKTDFIKKKKLVVDYTATNIQL